ncbi:response regulator [Pseudomonas anguilliseptica]|uniref:response regulator n=1 Tax=Pseudomonas anguilliseptica TaxID=53406 RepID=UPI00325B1CE7
MEKIFEPFAQADASMSRRFGGTGLGTTISRQLVELMGGRLRVESTLGEGSRFIVELPLRAGQQLAPQVRQALPQLAALHILAADDVPQNLELLQLNLQRLGHQVTCVADGQAAVEAFISGRFDLVLMDVQMPLVDGLEASRRIRALEATQQRVQLPIIALTASVLDQDRQAALDAGMNGFASKPLDLPALLAEMARLLGTTQEPGAVEHTAAATSGLFDWQRGASLWGGPVQMSQAIQRFLAEQDALVEQLGSMLEKNDWDTGRSLAHRFRGAAANLALTHLSGLGQAIEQAFNRREGLHLRSLLQVPATTTETQTLDLEQLRAALLRLQHAVSRGGLDDQALDCLSLGLQGAQQKKALARIRQALDDFDFEQAQQALSELLQQLHDEESQTP